MDKLEDNSKKLENSRKLKKNCKSIEGKFEENSRSLKEQIEEN